jgi:hypothetical protein
MQDAKLRRSDRPTGSPQLTGVTSEREGASVKTQSLGGATSPSTPRSTYRACSAGSGSPRDSAKMVINIESASGFGSRRGWVLTHNGPLGPGACRGVWSFFELVPAQIRAAFPSLCRWVDPRSQALPCGNEEFHGFTRDNVCRTDARARRQCCLQDNEFLSPFPSPDGSEKNWGTCSRCRIGPVQSAREERGSIEAVSTFAGGGPPAGAS